MATATKPQITTVTKTGWLAPVYGYLDANGVWKHKNNLRYRIYKSSTQAQIIEIEGVWVKVRKSRTRRGSCTMQYDLQKPYKFPTRAYRSDKEKGEDKRADRAAALKRARKVLSKKDLKALGLVK